MIVTRQQYFPQQLNIINSLAERSGISLEMAKILYSRGIDTVNKIRRFLSPGMEHFSSPMLLKGMAESVERITAARDNGECVVIYGDYDADGICATSILYYALRDFGIDAYPVIPERADGYGLSEKLIDAVMEEYNPDLIVTVDCGISGYKEVCYVQELGVDIIVTDHHELPEILPQCITVNCKFKDQEYPFDSLCGAGVAYKLACALIGKKANAYLDFAALATVADSMPLIDENRDIVYEGLKLIASPSARPQFKALINAAKARDINSTSLAYVLAPRINAAGRMGDARCALNLFLSESPSEIFDLAARLCKYNIQRQAECDELYASAKVKLNEKGAYKRVIVLEDSTWKNGLVGITAAKLVEEYTRPVIMFVNKNGILHGSARSVEEINILEAIAYNKEYLVEFGGHSQAAGVTLKAENLAAFEDGLDRFISEKYGAEVFVPKQEIEDYTDSVFTLDFARELNLLEPCGTGNRKPLFAVECSKIQPRAMRENSPHITFSTDYIDLIYFNGEQYLDLLRSPVKKTVVFEPSISSYGGNDTLRGIVKTFETEILPEKELRLELFMKNLRNLKSRNGGERAEYLPQDKIKEIIADSITCPYGTMFVISNLKTLESFPELKDLQVNLNSPRLKNLSNCVVLTLNGRVTGFRRIIFLDNPIFAVKKVKSAEVYVNADLRVEDVFPKLDATREGVGKVFSLLRLKSGIQANNSAELYFSVCGEVPDITRYQFVFAAEVLAELGVIDFENGKMRYDRTVKCNLSDSKIFTKFSGGN